MTMPLMHTNRHRQNSSDTQQRRNRLGRSLFAFHLAHQIERNGLPAANIPPASSIQGNDATPMRIPLHEEPEYLRVNSRRQGRPRRSAQCDPGQTPAEASNAGVAPIVLASPAR